jgi:hypothetical protein
MTVDGVRNDEALICWNREERTGRRFALNEIDFRATVSW